MLGIGFHDLVAISSFKDMQISSDIDSLVKFLNTILNYFVNVYGSFVKSPPPLKTCSGIEYTKGTLTF